MPPNRRRTANGLSGETFDPWAPRQMFSCNLLWMLWPDRLLLGAESSLVGTPSIGLKMRQTTWPSTLLQFSEHGGCLRSHARREDRTPVRGNRRPPPPLMPCVAHIAPPLVHLRRVDWLETTFTSCGTRFPKIASCTYGRSGSCVECVHHGRRTPVQHTCRISNAAAVQGYLDNLGFYCL